MLKTKMCFPHLNNWQLSHGFKSKLNDGITCLVVYGFSNWSSPTRLGKFYLKVAKLFGDLLGLSE